MKPQSTDKGIRPGILLAGVGFIAVTLALSWVLKSTPAPTDVTVEAVASMSTSASAKPATALKRIERAEAASVAVNTAPPRLPGATRLSTPEMGTDTTAPVAATGLVRFQSTGAFDYRTQAARVTEAVRSAIAQDERGASARLPGSATEFAQSQSAGRFVDPAQPGPVGRIPYAIRQPENGGAARSPGAANQFGGSPGADHALPPPQLGGDAASPPASGGQVSQDPGPPGAPPVVHNVVEEYREGERLRRAYVEEMRLKRVVLIAEARQRESYEP